MINGMGWGMGFGWLLPLAIVVGLFYLFRRDGGGSKERTPLEVLQERFAAGEIDEEEYLQRRKILQEGA